MNNAQTGSDIDKYQTDGWLAHPSQQCKNIITVQPACFAITLMAGMTLTYKTYFTRVLPHSCQKFHVGLCVRI